MNKLFLVLIGGLIMLSGIVGCGSIPFVAQNEPTATPTVKRIRPTFTPKPSRTPTVEVTPTEAQVEATETPDNSDAIPADTPIPATKTPAKPAAPPPPKATAPPPPPPAPKFAVTASGQFFCQQDGVFEVTIHAVGQKLKKTRPWAGGLWVAALDPGGALLVDGAGKPLAAQTQEEGSISYGSNCHNDYDRLHPDTQNGKIDVVDAVKRGTTKMIIRFVKSPTDLTPISPDYPIDFGTSGRWWFFVVAQ